MKQVLEIERLKKGFTLHHLKKDIAAFDEISFNVNAGEFVLIKGANGAGKSTLLRTLYRSYLPQDGIIRFHSSHGPIDLARAADVDISYLRKTEFGFVTQSPGLISAYLIFCGFLAVSQVPTVSLKSFKIPSAYMFIVVPMMIMHMASLLIYPWETLTVMSLLYLVCMPIFAIRHRSLTEAD